MTENSKLIVGFTGTRHGMSWQQKFCVKHLLARFWRELPGRDHFFHHGCARGADSEAHALAYEMGYRVTAHPGPRNQWDNFYGFPLDQYSRIEPRKNFHPRNDNIVAACDVLVGTPQNGQWKLSSRGGSWYTIREAIKRGKSYYVVLSDGTIHRGMGNDYYGVLLPSDLEWRQTFPEES